MANKATRIIWLDLVRVLAIYFVVLVHSSSASQNPINLLPVSSALASTCVPLFVMLSGALLLNKKESYSIFYRKRFLRLIRPWITWTLIYVIFKLWQNPAFGIPRLLLLFTSTFTSFWFLPMIAALYLITPALRILVANAKSRDILFLIALWFLGICVLPYYRNSMAFPFYVDDGLVRQVFTYLGYFLLGGVLVRVRLPKLWRLMSGLCLGIALSLINYLFTTLNHQPNSSFSFNYIFPGIVIASASLFAIIRTFAGRLNNLNHRVKSWLISLSTAALGIYFVHGLLTDWFLRALGRPYLFKINFLGEWVNSLVLFGISYLIIFVLTRIWFIRNFIT